MYLFSLADEIVLGLEGGLWRTSASAERTVPVLNLISVFLESLLRFFLKVQDPG